jgi:hypothetical protein
MTEFYFLTDCRIHFRNAVPSAFVARASDDFIERCGGNLFDGPKQNAINGILHCELNTGSPLIGQAY